MAEIVRAQKRRLYIVHCNESKGKLGDKERINGGKGMNSESLMRTEEQSDLLGSKF